MEQEVQQQPVISEAPNGTTSPAPNEGERFTQDDVNRIVAERARRASESAIKGLLEAAGLGSADELKSLVEETRKAKEAELSQSERLQKQIDALEQRAKAAEDALKEAEAKRRRDAAENALRVAASDAYDASEVVLLIRATKATEVDAILSEDGSPDEKRARALVDALKKEKAHLFKGAAPGSPSNADGKPRTTPEFKFPKITL